MRSSLLKKTSLSALLAAVCVLIPFANGIASAANTTSPTQIPVSVQQYCKDESSNVYTPQNTPQIFNEAPGGAAFACDKGNLNYEYFDAAGTDLGMQISVGGSTLRQTPDGTLTDVSGHTECTGWKYVGSLGTCVFRSFVSGLGAVLMSLTAWLLGVSGLLFNWIVNNSVVSFGSLYLQVQQGVVTAWSAFRDIANILIIGVFVFVAISFILGIQEYGQKKYVARILVIAVLINFSLLFTEMIIDFSNFTAGQFYSATFNQVGGVAQANLTASTTIQDLSSPQSNGIAGKFIAMTGVTTFGESLSALNTIAQNNDNGWLALLHGLVAATLYLATALVLLYGSYILIVRAILLIFVLLTSSIAFATYIIPGQSFVKQGWDAWWNALIRSSVLAPLLMVFLWATAMIGTQLTQASNGGINLASLSGTPPGGTSVQALFNYFIILGLLFASFKVANGLASSLAGFNLPAQLATGAFALASRFAIAPPLRQVAGRVFAQKQEAKSAEAKKSRDNLLTLQEGTAEYNAAVRKTAKLQRQAGKAGRYADSKFNLMDREAAKSLTKAIGLKGVFSGQTPKSTKGFLTRVEDKAKEAQKVAEKIEPGKTDIEKIQFAAETKSRETQGERLREAAEKRREAQEASELQQKNAKTAEERNAEAQKVRDEAAKSREDKLVEAYKASGKDTSELQAKIPEGLTKAFQEQIANVSDTARHGEFSEQLKNAIAPAQFQKLSSEIANAINDPVKKAAATENLARAQREHESTLRQEDDRVSRARTEILKKANIDTTLIPQVQSQTEALNQANRNLEVTRSDVREAQRLRVEKDRLSTAANAEYNRVNSAIQDVAKKAGQDAVKAFLAGASAVEKEIGRQSTWTAKERVGKKVEESIRKKRGRHERLTELVKEIEHEEHPAETPEPPAASPETPAADGGRH